MKKREKNILKKAVNSDEGLISPATMINGYAGGNQRLVEMLVSHGYLERVYSFREGLHNATYSIIFYAVTEKGQVSISSFPKRVWFSFKSLTALWVGIASILFGIVSTYVSWYTVKNSIEQNKISSQIAYLNYSPKYNETLKFTPFESDIKVENEGRVGIHNVQPEFTDIYVNPSTILVQGMESMTYDLEPGDIKNISIPSNLKVKGKTILVKVCYLFNDNAFNTVIDSINPIELKRDLFYESNRRFQAYNEYKCSSVIIKYNNMLQPTIL